MAKKFSSFLTYYDGPTTGFSEGTMRDNPGDDTGSGVLATWGNDMAYAIYAMAKKYLPLGEVSDTAESENSSDMRSAIEHMSGLQVDGVSKYDNTVTYAKDDNVMYLGIQFISMKDGNVGNNPLTSPSNWLPAPDRLELLREHSDGMPLSGGFRPLHDFSHSDYRQSFYLGKHNFGGTDAGGAEGQYFDVWGVHLDSSQVTDGGTLQNIFDVGGSNEYHLIDTVAPESLGDRYLLDTRARVERSKDDGTLTPAIGTTQEDQFQAWQLGADEDDDGPRDYWGIVRGRDRRFDGAFSSTGHTFPRYTTAVQGDSRMLKAKNDGTNGDIRQGSETRAKSFITGVKYIIVMKPAA